MSDDYFPFNRMKVLMLQLSAQKKTRITYEDIARETGLSVNTVERYANNRVVRPDLRVVQKLCNYFGVPLNEFVIQPGDEFPEYVAVAAS